MRMARIAATMLCAAGLVGCAVPIAYSTPVRMHHTDGRVATCGPYVSSGLPATAGAIRETQCIQDYQRQGFERVPE